MVTSKIGPMGVDQRRLLDEILGNLNRGNLDFLVRVFFRSISQNFVTGITTYKTNKSIRQTKFYLEIFSTDTICSNLTVNFTSHILKALVWLWSVVVFEGRKVNVWFRVWQNVEKIINFDGFVFIFIRFDLIRFDYDSLTAYQTHKWDLQGIECSYKI